MVKYLQSQSGKTRTFLAFKLPEATRKMCVEFQKKLNEFFDGDVGVKWVEPENLHVTLAFLGNLENKQLKELIVRLERINGYKFTFKIDKLNWNGYEKIPRVLWLELKGKSARSLYLCVKSVLRSLKIKVEDREYIPHITLGRVKWVKRRPRFSGGKVFECCGLRPAEKFEVDCFQVISSFLTSNGPVYKVNRTISLKDISCVDS